VVLPSNKTNNLANSPKPLLLDGFIGAVCASVRLKSSRAWELAAKSVSMDAVIINASESGTAKGWGGIISAGGAGIIAIEDGLATRQRVNTTDILSWPFFSLASLINSWVASAMSKSVSYTHLTLPTT
jgi:hypothetical protein